MSENITCPVCLQDVALIEHRGQNEAPRFTVMEHHTPGSIQLCTASGEGFDPATRKLIV
jgi:hypothetical protein